MWISSKVVRTGSCSRAIDCLQSVAAFIKMCTIYSSVFQKFLLADPFWLRKITTDPHILAHVNSVRMIGTKIKNVYLRTDCRQLPIHASSTRNDALHNLTLIKMIIARFVGTGSFLIRYVDGHTQHSHYQLQKFLDYF